MMIGYVNHSLFRIFSDYLLKFGAAYRVPVSVIDLQSIIHHYFGEALVVDTWNGHVLSTALSDFPGYLDASGNLFSEKIENNYDPGFLQWVHKNTKVLKQASLPKEKLAIALLSSELSLYAIPTLRIETYNELVHSLLYLKNALIKPSNGRQGNGVRRLFLQNGIIKSQNQFGMYDFSEEEFLAYLSSNANERLGKSVLLQPYLDFSFDCSHALDFRLLRHRGRTGNWEEVATYARIGSNSIVSNVYQGGFIADVMDTLRPIAGDRANSLFEEIMYLGEAVPNLIQKYRGDDAFCLGVDIAIDRQTLRPFVLEANTYPGAKYFLCQLAEKRIQYYQYLLEQ